MKPVGNCRSSCCHVSKDENHTFEGSRTCMFPKLLCWSTHQSTMYPLHGVFGNIRRELNPTPQPETSAGSSVSQHREDDDFSVIGDTPSERTEVRPTMFSLHEVFLNLRRKLRPPPQQETTAGGGVSQTVIPDHLSKHREDDDFLVIGETASERTEVRPGQPNWVTQSELPLMSADCHMPLDFQPPSYEDAEAKERELARGQQHPAADIPFTLHPLLQVVMDRAANTDGSTPMVDPLDLDKFLYDFTLEEEVKSNEARYRVFNHPSPETVREPTHR